jgi:predicted RNA-binding protein YlxR (DUF448 family)
MERAHPLTAVPDPAREAHKTHAEATRARRDIVSGEVMGEARLLRFVLGPDGAVLPDFARKLPGRGMWVEARREAVNTAVKRGAFSRAAKTKVAAASDLADQVERGLIRRLSHTLGLARRSGDLTLGFEKAASALEGGKAAWMIEAADGAPDGRRKLLNIARRSAKPPRLFGVFTAQELSLALGVEPVVHCVFLAGRGVEGWTHDVERLSGFRPLLPESWREGRVEDGHVEDGRAENGQIEDGTSDLPVPFGIERGSEAPGRQEVIGLQDVIGSQEK